MADDIIARLRLSGEQFSKDTKTLFAGVPAAAEQAGLAAGQSLAKGVKGGTGEIAAAVGQATQSLTSYERQYVRTAAIVDRFAAEQATATAAVTAAKAAYKAGEIGLEQYNAEMLRSKVVLAGVRAEYDVAVRELNDVARAQAALNVQQRGSIATTGQQQAGMQQLAYQIGDVGAQAAAMGLSVTNVTRIIAVQGSQFVQAIAMMRGSATGFIGFLGGPWGAAIMAGVSVLAMLGAQALETGDDMAEAAKKADELAAALERIGNLNFTGTDIDALMKRAAELGGQAGELERRAREAGADRGAGGRYYQEQAAALRRERDELLGRVREAVNPTSAAASIVLRNRALMNRDAPDRTRSRGLSDAEKAAREDALEREQAAEAAKRAEESFEEAVQRTLQAQQDSLRVEQVRAEQGEIGAAGEQARLAFLQQQPLAVHQTVEALAKALGITEALNVAERERLQNLIAAADAAEGRAVRAAEDAERRQIDEKVRSKEETAFRELQRQAEEAGRMWEDQVRDVASLYEELFTGGTDRVWQNFRREGLRIVAEIAAQWTLATISGQSRGSLGQTANAVLARSPLGALFGVASGAGVTGSMAANDNMILKGSGVMAGLPKGWAGVANTGGLAEPNKIVVSGKRPSLLDQAGVSITAASIASSIGLGGGTAGSVLGLGGAIGGQALGASLGMLGSFGGPIGALAGAVIGNLVGGLFGSSKYGTAALTGSGMAVNAKGDGRSSGASTLGGGVQGTLAEIAEALGVNLGSYRVSIGTYKDNFRVSTSGRTGQLKDKYSDVHDFGSEAEAVEFAIRDAIRDGAIQGLSAASQAILRGSGELQAAIDKVLLIESVPKLLRQRLDPLGAELEAIDTKFRELFDTLREGGATAEQMAEAEKLYRLEREDTMKQLGDASAGLKGFLSSLMAGSNSPLSLRQQRAEAEAAFKPYSDAVGKARDARSEVDRLKATGASASAIAAAEQAARSAAQGIDQQGFQQAAQLLLGVTRGMDASGESFFATFDRIKNLTGGGIGALDSAAGAYGTGKDPFAELVAKNTGDTANILADHTRLLQSINERLGPRAMANDNWLNDGRQFV